MYVYPLNNWISIQNLHVEAKHVIHDMSIFLGR